MSIEPRSKRFVEGLFHQGSNVSLLQMKFVPVCLAAVSIIVAHHVINDQSGMKPLDPDMKELCRIGVFHPDCSNEHES